jgi:hypothetical protein
LRWQAMMVQWQLFIKVEIGGHPSYIFSVIEVDLSSKHNSLDILLVLKLPLQIQQFFLDTNATDKKQQGKALYFTSFCPRQSTSKFGSLGITVN